MNSKSWYYHPFGCCYLLRGKNINKLFTKTHSEFLPIFLELPFLHTLGLSHFIIGQLQLYNPFLALTTTTPSHINLSSMPLIRNILSKSSISRKQNSVAKSFVLT